MPWTLVHREPVPGRGPAQAARPSERAAGSNWPLSEQAMHFELGLILNSAAIDAIDPGSIGSLATHHAGLWECNLADESLIWSGGVYDMFGVARGVPLNRGDVLACYSEESRCRLERLRAHAIRHGVGFTIDVEIRAAAVAEDRRMRILAAPTGDEASGARLHGLKLII